MIVEVCSNSLESALNAEKAGADRIELCSELAVGGITPSYGLLKAVREQISIPVRVLIRPRGGDFTYSSQEFEIIKTDITLCRELGFDGIVSGILNLDFSLDIERTKELVEACGNLPFTFHRAFDWVNDPEKTLQQLEGIGVDTLLTSGQSKKAVDGIELLSKIHQKSAGCSIMPGSGINATNAHLFREKGFKAIHLSGVLKHQTLSNKTKVSMNSPQMLSDRDLFISNFETIQDVVRTAQ